jgi:hypothetical protein
VRSTCPGSATLSAKSLTIVFDGSAEALLLYGLIVRDLAAGQRVVIRGLDPTLPASLAGGLTLADNSGHVWVEDCRFLGTMGWAGFFGFPMPGLPGLLVSGSDSVTVVRCRLNGGGGVSGQIVPPNICAPASQGGPGARVQFGSNVAFFDCEFSGGDGGDGNVCLTSAGGGDGLHVADSDVFLSACTGTGGSGGAAGNTGIGSGGTGLRVDGSGAVAARDGSFAGGAGGTGPGGATGTDGLPVQAAPGAVTEIDEPARSLALPSPLREHEAGVLTLHGVQGDLVGFFWSFQGLSLPVGNLEGWFVLGTPLLGPFTLGAITAPSGQLAIPFNAPALVPSLQSMTFLLQPLFKQPGGLTLGAPSAFTLVDDAL